MHTPIGQMPIQSYQVIKGAYDLDEDMTNYNVYPHTPLAHHSNFVQSPQDQYYRPQFKRKP